MPTDPPFPADPARCPSCSALLPAQAPQGLCPKCLFAGLAGATDDGAGTSSPVPLPRPEELAPHFPQLEILDCLGRGGMGVVYRTRQKSLDRIVALKLLAPERVGDPAFAERFAREAQALAKLNHPHIVTIHDFGEAGGFFYLLMEFVDGVNLRQAMQAGRFTPEQALAIVPPVCDALQYAHEHGIVHRDIKPENLLLDRAGRVMIADFGIAKMLGAETSVGLAQSQPAGTPQYMAPEQQDHRPADHRADIYSLGVVFYEMLTGELPAKQIEVPSRKVQMDVRIDEIVLRALERTPELRYQTAGEFRTQVETIAGGAGVPPAVPGVATAGHREEAGGVGDPPSFSRLAIVGAAWVPLFLLAFVIFQILFTAHQVRPGDPVPSGRGAGVWLMMAVMLLGFAAPLGTTILGWVAFVQIRRSSGRLRGKGLALFDGLFFPVLAVVAVTIALVVFLAKASSMPSRLSAPFIELGDAAMAAQRNEEAGIRQVHFQFNHPDETGGAGVTIREKYGRETRWKPSTGQGVTLKNGTVLKFRVRIDTRTPGSVEAWVQASLPDGDWETRGVVLVERKTSAALDFANGLHAVVSLLEDAPRQTKAAQTIRAVPNPPASVPETVREFGVSPGALIGQMVSLILILGFLYLVYRVWRRYGWWAALLLVLAGIAVLLMLTVRRSRVSVGSVTFQPVVSKLENGPPGTPPRVESVVQPAASTASASAANSADEAKLGEPTLDTVLAVLRPILARLDPKPAIEWKNDSPRSLEIRYLPQTYTIHGRAKTGQVEGGSFQKVGPSFRGFVLRVHVQPKGEVNQAVTPQTLQEAYWQTDLDVKPIAGTDRQIYWALSYAGRPPTDALNEIRAALKNLGKAAGERHQNPEPP